MKRHRNFRTCFDERFSAKILVNGDFGENAPDHPNMGTTTNWFRKTQSYNASRLLQDVGSGDFS